MQRYVALGCAWLTALLMACSALPSTVLADDEGSYDDPPPEPALITLSISPLHLLIPMLELQAELRVGSMLGISAIGGFGRIPATTAHDKTLHFKAYEVGGQVVLYPSDVFQGLHFGVETIYMRVNVEDEIGDERISGVGAGLAVGPLLGYKWISAPGFSVFIQGGFTVLVSKANAKNDLGESATRKENDLLLLLNVNLGWSF